MRFAAGKHQAPYGAGEIAMSDNPSGWPEELLLVADKFATCEYASLTRNNTPITWPLTPYMGEDSRTIDVSTGLAYPSKAERARRNPKVSLLFSYPEGSGLSNPPVVLVHGLAAVRDRDVQAGTDRYVRLGIARFPEAYKGQPAFLLKQQQWYYTRAWILVTPLKVLTWSQGKVDGPPQVWTAPEDTSAPPSDPPPDGLAPGGWNKGPEDWHKGAEYALANLGLPVLTVVDQAAGFPVPFRSKSVRLTSEGFTLEMPSGMPAAPEGAACLTFHAHPTVFVSQENTSFIGEAASLGGSVQFRVERQLGDFSLGKSKLSTTINFLISGFKLRPHLKRELARRNQPMPKINLPRR
jgi:hypothetical protein